MLKKTTLRLVANFQIEQAVSDIMKTLSCCGIDYAVVNENSTWAAPLTLHPFAISFQQDHDYRSSDPFHHYPSIFYLPKLCHLSEIAIGSKNPSWQNLLNPHGLKSCSAVSFCIQSKMTIHRFLLFFDSIHKLRFFYLQLSELHLLLAPLIEMMAPVTVRYYDEFAILPAALKPLKLPPTFYKRSNSLTLTHELGISEKEFNYFHLLSTGISEKKTAAQMLGVTLRTIDSYTKSIKAKLNIRSTPHLFEYAKLYMLL